MTLRQLSQIKRWMVLHGRRHAVELQVWDLVLCCWVLGWVALPGMLLIKAWLALPALMLAMQLPALYVRWRVRLHRGGRVRCDWLCAL